MSKGLPSGGVKTGFSTGLSQEIQANPKGESQPDFVSLLVRLKHAHI